MILISLGSVLWAVIFFVMLLVLGVDSEFCNVEALVTGIVDNWPHLLMKHRSVKIKPCLINISSSFRGREFTSFQSPK